MKHRKTAMKNDRAEYSAFAIRVTVLRVLRQWWVVAITSIILVTAQLLPLMFADLADRALENRRLMRTYQIVADPGNSNDPAIAAARSLRADFHSITIDGWCREWLLERRCVLGRPSPMRGWWPTGNVAPGTPPDPEVVVRQIGYPLRFITHSATRFQNPRISSLSVSVPQLTINLLIAFLVVAAAFTVASASLSCWRMLRSGCLGCGYRLRGNRSTDEACPECGCRSRTLQKPLPH
jgi:hypothetical protein